LNWRDHLNHTEENAIKIGQQLSTVACTTWRLKSAVVKSIYSGAIEPLVLYAVQIWDTVLSTAWAVNKLHEIQLVFLLRICKAYRTLSHESLCVTADVAPLLPRLKKLSLLD